MKISNKEYEYFSKLLAQKFELRGNHTFNVSLNDIETILGQPLLIMNKTEYVDKIKQKSLPVNQIVFYSDTKKNGAFMLAKHFRNCASHAGRMTKNKKDANFIYMFEDVYGSKATMRCKLTLETLTKLINTL